jgi:hypothetical protein
MLHKGDGEREKRSRKEKENCRRNLHKTHIIGDEYFSLQFTLFATSPPPPLARHTHLPCPLYAVFISNFIVLVCRAIAIVHLMNLMCDIRLECIQVDVIGEIVVVVVI